MNYDKNKYQKYRNTKSWKVLEEAIDELIENQDLIITTKKEYVIGYLCEKYVSQVIK